MKWVQSYLYTENKGKWKVFFDSYLEKCGRKLVFLCNLKEIVEYWSNSNYSYSFPVNICMYLA